MLPARYEKELFFPLYFRSVSVVRASADKFYRLSLFRHFESYFARNSNRFAQKKIPIENVFGCVCMGMMSVRVVRTIVWVTCLNIWKNLTANKIKKCEMYESLWFIPFVKGKYIYVGCCDVNDREWKTIRQGFFVVLVRK